MAHIRFDQLPGGATFWLQNGEEWEKLWESVLIENAHTCKTPHNAKRTVDGKVELRRVEGCTLVRKTPPIQRDTVVAFRPRAVTPRET